MFCLELSASTSPANNLFCSIIFMTTFAAQLSNLHRDRTREPGVQNSLGALLSSSCPSISLVTLCTLQTVIPDFTPLDCLIRNLRFAVSWILNVWLSDKCFNQISLNFYLFFSWFWTWRKACHSLKGPSIMGWGILKIPQNKVEVSYSCVHLFNQFWFPTNSSSGPVKKLAQWHRNKLTS